VALRLVPETTRKPLLPPLIRIVLWDPPVELRSQRIENQNLSGLGGGYAASPSQEKISNQGVDDSQGAGNFSAADNSPFRKPRDWAARNLASEQMVFSARERM